MCEICSKLTIKTPERRHRRLSGVFIVNVEQISHVVLVFLLLTLNKYMPAGLVVVLKSLKEYYSTDIDFEQIFLLIDILIPTFSVT